MLYLFFFFLSLIIYFVFEMCARSGVDKFEGLCLLSLSAQHSFFATN